VILLDKSFVWIASAEPFGYVMLFDKDSGNKFDQPKVKLTL
jgi:hypothetical protein